MQYTFLHAGRRSGNIMRAGPNIQRRSRRCGGREREREAMHTGYVIDRGADEAAARC